MSGSSRRVLARQAMLKSIDLRTRAGLDLVSPLDIYALCDTLGIPVRFVGINMEGMYVRGQPSRIMISALRPLPRRTYTCAHELGHHEFGHGSTIVELVDELRAGTVFKPDEFLVQTFAGFLLMPTVGVKNAFATRGWSATTATPAAIFTVACSFGVGYATLVNHLAYGLGMLSPARAHQLLAITLERVRREVLGSTSSAPLIVADRQWALPTLDAEVGTQILLPPVVDVDGGSLAWRADLATGRLFEAARPGVARARCPTTGWAVSVRIARYQFVGLSRYRHLEETDEDDESPTGEA